VIYSSERDANTTVGSDLEQDWSDDEPKKRPLILRLPPSRLSISCTQSTVVASSSDEVLPLDINPTLTNGDNGHIVEQIVKQVYDIGLNLVVIFILSGCLFNDRSYFGR
jgi:hypothetical protein